MPLAQTLLVGIALLGGLVFFHELGHFLAAKYFRVKVLKFSLGFGPRVFGFRRGETEYQVAALPLGGFVRMAGQDPSEKLAPEDRGRGFLEQSPFRRATIALAGPAVNLLLPPLVFFLVHLSPQVTEPAVVGLVVPGEPAERAGLEPGDRVLSVDGVPTRSFHEMREAVESRGGRRIEIVVDRLGERRTLELIPSSETETNPIETTKKGRIGVVAGKLRSYVGVEQGTRAWAAGLRPFDQVVAVNGQSVATGSELKRALRDAGDAPLTLAVQRPRAVPLNTASLGTVETLTLEIPAGAEPLGLDAPDLYLRAVDEKGAAFAAGLRPWDKVVALDGTAVVSRIRLAKMLEDLKPELVGGRRSLAFTVQRGPERLEVAFTPPVVERRDPMLGMVKEPDYGFAFDDRVFMGEPFTPDEMVTVQYGVAEAFSRAIDQTVLVTRSMTLAIAGLFTGRVPTESIGGPIMLFQLAGQSAERGLADFLRLFAFISINLGLINLLPVPILDGFHIVVSGIEGISRRPVPMRFREVANYIGLAMLLALMVLAFKNDIVRTLAQ